VPASTSLALIRAARGRCNRRRRAVGRDWGSIGGFGCRAVRLTHGSTGEAALGGRTAHVAHAGPPRRGR
jgi:hypothetical protein